MIKPIPYLKENDTIAIVSPAKAIDTSLVENAKDFLESNGFTVLLGKHCTNRHHYFSGTLKERRDDFQVALDNKAVKAILCARGGYGCVQFIDQLNWSRFIEAPKWIIGFSDITVFHQHLSTMGFPSIHGTMPLNFHDNTGESLQGLLNSITGANCDITLTRSKWDVDGKATGELSGGNLSILYSLLGTDSQADYNDSILFVEDLCEPLYHIDRIFNSFKKAGVLNQINGLIIGGMTDMKDTEVPFGLSLEEIILSHVGGLGIPVAFNFPAGHINDNRPLKMGSIVELEVSKQNSSISYL